MIKKEKLDIIENSKSALEALDNYSKNLINFISLENHKQLFTTIDDRIASFDHDVPQELLKIQQKLSTFPLKHISFNDNNIGLLKLTEYQKNKILGDKKLHYTFPAQLIKDAQYEYAKLLMNYFQNKKLIGLKKNEIDTNRERIIYFAIFLQASLFVSCFLSVCAIVPAAILNPINLLIGFVAYITATYMMFLPEHLKDEDKQNSHNLYHFGLFNLYIAIPLLVLGIILQAWAPGLLIIVLMTLITLAPIFAYTYKNALLDNRYSELNVAMPEKKQFFRDRVQGCSLFEVKEYNDGYPYFAFNSEEPSLAN